MSPELSKGRFERLEHTVYGGDEYELPLWVDRQFGLTDESNALLHAANIIGGNLADFGDDIGNVAERLGMLLDDETQTGTIIADEYGKGSLTITPGVTTVAINEVGTWEIPTVLLFDMIDTWTNMSEKDF